MTGSVAPGGCSVVLTNAAIALGTLPQSTVKGYTAIAGTGTGAAVYSVGLPNVGFTVTCTAATRVGLGFVDNNAGKNLIQGKYDVLNFGLVDSATGTSIGGFGFYMGNVLMDGVGTPKMFSSPTSTTPVWVTTNILGTDLMGYNGAPGNMNGFAKVSTATSPDSALKITGNLVGFINLGKTIVDSMTTALSPTGSATLTLIYL